MFKWQVRVHVQPQKNGQVQWQGFLCTCTTWAYLDIWTITFTLRHVAVACCLSDRHRDYRCLSLLRNTKALLHQRKTPNYAGLAVASASCYVLCVTLLHGHGHDADADTDTAVQLQSALYVPDPECECCILFIYRMVIVRATGLFFNLKKKIFISTSTSTSTSISIVSLLLLLY